jgi:hypothetical protein
MNLITIAKNVESAANNLNWKTSDFKIANTGSVYVELVME